MPVDYEQNYMLSFDATKNCLIVFSDLDGTLLDHTTYSWQDAAIALTLMRDQSVPLILASSKTAAEIDTLRLDMGFDHCPAIVENGAGILEPNGLSQLDTTLYFRLREALNDLPATLRLKYQGFGDWSVQQVAEKTGLSIKASLAAKTRNFSEPGVWSGSNDEFLAFCNHLMEQGITVQQGGRFATLSYGADKAQQMKDIMTRYQSPGSTPYSVALGDASNDIAMLEAADCGIIIPNPGHAGIPTLEGEKNGTIIRGNHAGPLGWNEALIPILNRLKTR